MYCQRLSPKHSYKNEETRATDFRILCVISSQGVDQCVNDMGIKWSETSKTTNDNIHRLEENKLVLPPGGY